MSEPTETTASNSNESATDKYLIITEGKAHAYFPKNEQVFYNPVQEFNRDLSIAVLNTYANSNNKKLRILEALAASGIRSMRYALEINNVNEIIANDFDKSAVELIDLNIKLNNVADKVKSNCDDASGIMFNSSKRKSTLFDCIDLDPYGPPTPFLDASMRAIKNGGLMLVTATDAGVLCGNGADTCYTKYGAVSIRTPCCHEVALRILLQCLNSHAIRYSKYIVPLISLSIDFYFRLFFMVFDGQLKAKESATKVGYAYICSGCQTYYLQKFGTAQPTNNNFKFIHSHGPPCESKCNVCDGRLHVAGPLWLDNLHDKEFLAKVIDHVNNKTHLDYTTKDRMVGMLQLVNEEIDEPLFYVLGDMCSVLHCQTPNYDIFRSALVNENYQVSYSHCQKNSVKTNAPAHVIWDILRDWTANTPIGEKWLKPEHRVFHIMNKLESGEKKKYNFNLRKDAIPKSKVDKLIRYHDPPPNWGPKSRAKRSNSKNDETDKKKKKRDEMKNNSNNDKNPENKGNNEETNETDKIKIDNQQELKNE